MRSIDVSWQSETMTPTGSKQRPTATRDPKESTTRTRPRQRAPPFRYWGKRSPKRQTKQALAIASLSGWRSVSRLLATVVTIDNKAIDRGGCGRWTWRNLCSLGTPHLCPYLHQRRLFTRAPTLTLRRNISATEADIWKNRAQAQRNTSREISWHEKTTRIAIKARFYRVQSAVWWKLTDFVTPEVCRVCQKRIAVTKLLPARARSHSPLLASCMTRLKTAKPTRIKGEPLSGGGMDDENSEGELF